MTTVLSARDLVVNKGDTPVSLEVEDGLTIVQLRREAGGSTLAMALAGRYRYHSGDIDGPGFKRTALAGVVLIDSLERQVSVRETIREQVAWTQPFFGFTRKDILNHKVVTPWLEPLGLEDLDPSTAVGDLDVLTRFKLRVLLALVSRPDAELLIVDDIDQLKDMALRDAMMDVLADVAKHVPVLVTTVNEEL